MHRSRGVEDGGVDMSQTYLYFLMLHACLCTICFVFCYTSWHFYAFFGTNLLTRCHSASSLFSVIFVFQESYTGNILGIGRNEAWRSYFPPTRNGVQRRVGGGPGGNHTREWRGWTPGRATLWCGPPGPPLTSPLRLFKAFDAKTLNQSAFLPVKFRSAAAVEDQFWGTEVSVSAPCRDGEVPPEPSPSTPSPPPLSPSTSPPSPSTLRSPMMRRE
jgi:hypothetical protein